MKSAKNIISHCFLYFYAVMLAAKKIYQYNKKMYANLRMHLMLAHLYEDLWYGRKGDFV